MRHALLGGLVVLCVLMSTTPAAAERAWEFSFGGYGGWAFHADTTFRTNQLVNLIHPAFGAEPVHVKGRNHRFEDAGTFGAKLTAWHLPRQHNWQPQVGIEIDWTRFTADAPPQVIPADGVGLISGDHYGFINFNQRREFAIDNMALNLLFRYPIWATPEMPQGRWYPYVGVGGGAQRARLSILGYEETSYSPSFQGLVGVKFFVMKHLALYSEAKWTQGWHTFKYQTNDYWERYAIATIHLVGGVALHF